MRSAWGVKRETKVILITGRILRRKGHHVVVKAVKRLKEMGLKDFLCVFVGEDRGRTRYTGELWDLVLTTGTMDVIRMAAPVADMPAAYAAASVVVSAAIQPEGVQRAILEAQAMARPVIVSDLGAGAGRRAHGAGGARKPDCGISASIPAMMPRWRQPCCGCSQCRNRTGQPSAGAAANGCSAISMRRSLPSRRCGFIGEIAGLSMRRCPAQSRVRQNKSNLNTLTADFDRLTIDNVTEPR